MRMAPLNVHDHLPSILVLARPWPPSLRSSPSQALHEGLLRHCGVHGLQSPNGGGLQPQQQLLTIGQKLSPLVTVVIHGGLGTFKAVLSSLQRGHPVVVCADPNPNPNPNPNPHPHDEQAADNPIGRDPRYAPPWISENLDLLSDLTARSSFTPKPATASSVDAIQPIMTLEEFEAALTRAESSGHAAAFKFYSPVCRACLKVIN